MTDYNAQLAADIVVRNIGTIWTFTGQSLEGQDFLSTDVQSEDWQWFGHALAVDHRPARDLLDHITGTTALVTYLV